jgi:D-ribose pyranase
VATGVPTVPDLVGALAAAGDFEAAFVTEDMVKANPDGRQQVVDLFGEENVHEMRYLPDFYRLRDRVKAFIQTGDYGVHANVVLVAGYPSPVIPVEWLTSPDWLDRLDAPQER